MTKVSHSLDRSSARRWLGLALCLVLAATLAPYERADARSERPAPIGSDPFRPGMYYRGDFPDPTVLRSGGKYYAYATTIANLNLPLTVSTNLVDWRARQATNPRRSASNDALPAIPAWARRTRVGDRYFGATWAPSVARLGTRNFVAAYSVPRARDGVRCISIARATGPAGPFVDRSAAPLTCLGSAGGAIDPQIFRDGGRLWLLHKMEGRPDRLVVRSLNASGRGFSSGSRYHTLLLPAETWEGVVVENPAMIRLGGRLYLFYSGNGYGSEKYATGYAVCKTVTGGCVRMGQLLVSDSVLAGPGGATPFIGGTGRLRLAYHAWRAGQVGYPVNRSCLKTAAGCPQRRMYVATLAVGADGRLVVLSRR